MDYMSVYFLQISMQSLFYLLFKLFLGFVFVGPSRSLNFAFQLYVLTLPFELLKVFVNNSNKLFVYQSSSASLEAVKVASFSILG